MRELFSEICVTSDQFKAFQIKKFFRTFKMELINTNSENSFDPTPKLKSSPVPILFIPFNYNEDK